ncbi:MAG: acetate kinase [Bacteroidales bacterium]|nr:acetate kinase [Bacteroidales bacterium]
MKILVLNCGSSSIKYQLIEMIGETVIASGGVDRIGCGEGVLKLSKSIGNKIERNATVIDHEQGVDLILKLLLDPKDGVISSVNEIGAVGHRVVHGAETFSETVIIDSSVIAKLIEVSELAPLHNPANIAGIKAIQKVMPNVPQCGTFDTAFHQTMPPESYLYGIPYKFYEKYKIRRYGFHGSSHKYVSSTAANALNKDINTLKIITCHLGNGASLAAIKNGKVVDTTMGLTPLEGLVMGTRAGDFDLGALFYLMKKEKWTIDDADRVMNKESGMLGISGISSDMRDLYEALCNGNKRAKLAFDIYIQKVKKYVGAYAAEMNGLDVLIFTGGIGENQSYIRQNVCSGLEFMGVEFDNEINANAKCKLISLSKPTSKVTVMIVPTNEELIIARETLEKIKSI